MLVYLSIFFKLNLSFLECIGMIGAKANGVLVKNINECAEKFDNRMMRVDNNINIDNVNEHASEYFWIHEH